MHLDYLTLTTKQILQKRFKSIQEELKEKKCIKLTDFREFVLAKEPQYNCIKGWDKIKNTWYGKNPDLRITELISEYKQELLPI